ncbi:MAG: hypothetical protein AAGA78_02180, partial [Pseudomonadota bacterium]
LKIWEPGKTDGLIAQLEMLQEEMKELNTSQIEKQSILRSLDTQLQGIQAKAAYLEGLIAETLEVLPPYDPTGAHADYEKMRSDVYDPINLFQLASGGVAIAALLGVGLQFVGGTVVGYLFSSSGAQALAASATSGRLALLSKAGVYAALAALAIGFIIKLFKASEINDELRGKLEEMQEQVDEARKVEAQFDVAISQAQTQLDAILASAGVADLQGFMDHMTEAFNEVADEKVHMGTARRLLRMGMTTQDILGIIKGLDPNTLAKIETRLNAEILLVQGEDPAKVGRDIGLSAFQITIFQRILAARADAVLGVEADALATRHAISPAVAEMQVERANNALEDHWELVDSDDAMGGLALKTLVPAQAFVQLREILDAKQALSDGQSLDEVTAAYPDLNPEDLALWSERLETRKAEAASLASAGQMNRSDVAARLRLPLSLVPEAPLVAA